MRLNRHAKTIFLSITAIIALYIFFVNPEGNIFLSKACFAYMLFSLTFLFLVIMRMHRDLSLLSLDMLEKHNSLIRLLFDLREGTKTFYEEKRKSDRMKDKITVKIMTGYSSEFAKALDISYGGALLRTHKEVRQGDIIELNIYLPLFPEPISVKAKAMRVQPAAGYAKTVDIGVEYLNLTDIDKGKLLETIDILKKEEKGEKGGFDT